MKTINAIAARYMRKNPEIEIYLDNLESYAGCYRVFVGKVGELGSWYDFETVADFREWLREVEL